MVAAIVIIALLCVLDVMLFMACFELEKQQERGKPMKCAYKEFFDKKGECERTYPACLKELPYGVCGYMEKYEDLLADARAVAQELAEERGEYDN